MTDVVTVTGSSGCR